MAVILRKTSSVILSSDHRIKVAGSSAGCSYFFRGIHGQGLRRGPGAGWPARTVGAVKGQNE